MVVGRSAGGTGRRSTSGRRRSKPPNFEAGPVAGGRNPTEPTRRRVAFGSADDVGETPARSDDGAPPEISTAQHRVPSAASHTNDARGMRGLKSTLKAGR